MVIYGRAHVLRRVMDGVEIAVCCEYLSEYSSVLYHVNYFRNISLYRIALGTRNLPPNVIISGYLGGMELERN